MNSLGKQLFNSLNTVKGTGEFVVSGVKKSILAGMQIKGAGEVGFPLSPITVKALVGLAKKAPFGKGSATVLDPRVRSTWEIDASQISFLNPEWDDFIATILKRVKRGIVSCQA
jgi:hypothetical protein